MRVGDPDAYRNLVQTYQTYIFQLVYAVVKNRADAEDVTQETFLQIYRSLPLYEEKGLKTWMSRIAVNKAIDHRRSKQRKQEDALPEPHRLAPPDAAAQQFTPTAERVLIAQETEQAVRSRLEEVPDGYKEIIKAYYFDHKSYNDIAEEQGIAVKTVESKLYRAKQWMRKRWKEEDF